MKNSLKIAALALTIASFAACKGSGSASTDTTTVKTDSSVKTTVDTAAKADTTVKKDTVVKK
jgi:hypothetical protein